MTNTVAQHHLDYVSSHVNQTMLVDDLLQKGFLQYENTEGVHPDEYGMYPDICQWLHFPRFCSYDYDRLIDSKIPVLQSQHETWVGITSYGSPYRLYVYPELITAIFNIKCSGEDIANIQGD